MSVRYHASDKASVQYLFDTLSRDRRIDVWPGKDWGDMAHVDAYVVTDEVKKSSVATLEQYIARGGRVVIVADTPAELNAAKSVKGAIVVDSYGKVADALLK